MQVAWQKLEEPVQVAIHKAQTPWIGTRYSAHQREVGCGVSCYGLVAAILDTLYRKEGPTPLPMLNVNTGACSGEDAGLVLAFRRAYPLDEVVGCIEPGDLVVTRSVPGLLGPDWMGHVMMAGVRPGQAIHALPATGVTWGSFVSSLGRVLKIYRPRDKGSWAHG